MGGSDTETQDVASDETVAARPGRSANEHVEIRSGGGADYEALLEVDPKHYKFADELARGGMGRIVRAHDRRLGRGVAIKELLPGHDASRFEREAKITARLEHPSIVAVHEAGRWPSGEPFFAMKLVAGESLDKKIAACSTLQQRLELVPAVAAVVDALAYAHNAGVIHRDLKPSNVLVGRYGETVVIDWGLAKDLASNGPDLASISRASPGEGMTIVGSVLGTPAYMPPEQADGSPVDQRADVYALGALLYHVLAGRPPYDGGSSDDLLRAVLAGKPKRLADLAPNAPIELVAIVEKAMARGRAYRFQNAGEMADELRRFQTGQLITTHRYTFGELFQRWLRKYRAPISVGLIGFIALTIFGVVSISKIVQETRRADREAAEARARADLGTIERARSLLSTDPASALRALRELATGSKEWTTARTIVADAASRGVARIYEGDAQPLSDVSISPDGSLLAGRTDRYLLAWDMATGVKARWLVPRGVHAAEWVDHDFVFVDDDNVVMRWRPFHGGAERLVALTKTRNQAYLSENGHWATWTYLDNDRFTVHTVFVELSTGKRQELDSIDPFAWDGDAVIHVVRSSDNDNSDRMLERIDLRTGTRMLMSQKLHAAYPRVVRNGSIYGLVNQNIAINADDQVSTGHEGTIATFDVLPDGRLVTIAGVRGISGTGKDDTDNDIVITDGRVVSRLKGHKAPLTSLSLWHSTVVSADVHGEVRIWFQDPSTSTAGQIAPWGAFLDSQRDTLVEMGAYQCTDVINLATNIARRIPTTVKDTDCISPRHRAIMENDGFAYRMSIDRKHWVVRDDRNGVDLWDYDASRQICGAEPGPACGPFSRFAISGDGSTVIVVKNQHVTRFARGVFSTYALATGTDYLASSSRGDTLAYVYNGDVVIRQPSGEEVLLARDHVSGPIMFAPGDHAVVVADETTIKIIDIETRSVTMLTGHTGGVHSLGYDDQGRIVSLASDHTARIWNADGTVIVLTVPTTVERIDIKGKRAVTLEDAIVDISRDDRDRAQWIADNHALRVWDLDAQTSRLLPSVYPIFGGFTAGDEIIAVERDGHLSRYRDSTPYGEAALRTWIAALIGSDESLLRRW